MLWVRPLPMPARSSFTARRPTFETMCTRPAPLLRPSKTSGPILQWLGVFTLLVLLIGSVAAATGPRNEPIVPIPVDHGEDRVKAALGDRLFHDPRLSANNTLSCATCHRLSTGGTDGQSRSRGIGGAMGPIKAPSVYNSGFNLSQFWDGRAPTLEAQAAGPVHNPLEMGSSWDQVVAKLRVDPGYQALFNRLYSDGITGPNVQDAIATFERTLTTPGSAFDRWLEGDNEALTALERRGYALFKSYGCIACHQGVNVGGNMYQRMGALGNYFTERGGEITNADLGRFNVTGDELDRHMFKVPSLRLVAINPPYFHDGSVQDLGEAVRLMGRYQLDRDIPSQDVDAIVAFLHSLVGRHPRLTP